MSDPLSKGQSLSHYCIIRKLGAGGMGEVFLAEDTRLGRKVALKVLPADLINNRDRLHRFEQEARAASALNHPNIITIHEIGAENDAHFIAFEFIEGKTLREYLHSEETTFNAMLDIAVQTASALVTAHEAKIIHRDIKPENIMIRADGLVKVLDFGLAKLIEKPIEAVDSQATTQAFVQTNPGAVMGTVSYMSPEQARGKLVDARTDVWSLGVVLYEMLAGRLPFEGDTTSDYLAAILKTEPAPPSHFNGEIPAEFERIVLKTLAKDREERYQTVKDLLIDLKRLRKQIEISAEISRTPSASKNISLQNIPARLTASGEHKTGEIKNYKRGLLVVLFVLLLAAVGLSYRFFSNQPANINQIQLPAVNAPQSAPKLYWQMTEAEQLAFIQDRARHIQTLIGDEVTEFDETALQAIKAEINDYVEEEDSLSQKPFEEGLRVIYGRASQYAPLVIRAYEAQRVPPALGLYQAMVESEYHDCLINPSGPAGLFQFNPKTAAKYGLTAKDYCDVEKQSGAAAHFMADLSSDFGDGKSSATLGLAAFNIGENAVRDYLRQLRARGISERTFWAIFRHQKDLQPPLSNEGQKYVPNFFAAAIIGETPKSFELSTPPLTTLREKSR